MACSRSIKVAAALLAGVTLMATVGEASARVYYPGHAGYHNGHYGRYGYYHRGVGGPGVVAAGVTGAAVAGAADDQFTGWHNGYPAYIYQPAVYGFPFGYNYHPTFGYDYHPGSGYYGPY